MLYVRQSNQLERLADELIIQLQTIADPLFQQQIVVPSLGMATWFKHRLAEQKGIAAGVEFPLSATLIWRLILLLTDADNRSAYQESTMRWRLFALLDADNKALWQRTECAALKHFLQADKQDQKRFQLAGWIADLFDQYLIYRPHWMSAWRDEADAQNKLDTANLASELKLINAEQPWQPILWQLLVQACNNSPDRAQLQTQAQAKLATSATEITTLMRQQFGDQLPIFGLSAMPPKQLELIALLSRHIDVHFYVCNPCQEYWGDIVSTKYLARLTTKELTTEAGTDNHNHYATDHLLLSGMGHAGRDFIDLLAEFSDREEQVITAEDFIAPEGNQLLQHIQRDVLLMAAVKERPKHLLQKDDASVVFADSYGAMREVEALHDWLLGRFAHNAELMPKDIVVMIPDINAYLPHIEAVFSIADKELWIPYTICDHSEDLEVPIFSTLIQLLQLAQNRLTASELFDLLETPAIMRAFGLRHEHLPRLHHLIQISGIRWGRDTEHWQTTGANVAQEPCPYTWSFGLNRMMAGYSMGEEGDEFQGFAPLSGMESENDPAFRALLEFIERVDRYRARLKPATGSEWAVTLTDLVDDFLDCDLAETNALSQWYAIGNELAKLEEIGVKTPIGLEIILDILRNQKQKTRSSSRFLNGRVTFCTLMPMRNIPFRIVALLGLNEGSLPRHMTPISFNLLTQKPIKGDRNPRAEDLYMFLEAILSAKEHLYLSWSGRQPHDNKAQPPATVVTQLQDVINTSFKFEDGEDVIEHLSTLHPLQPFSAHRKGHDTYSKLWGLSSEEAAQPTVIETAKSHATKQAKIFELPELEVEQTLYLSELIRFYCDPAGYLLKSRLSVSSPSEQAQLFDSEPFALNGLERYQLQTEALQQLHSNDASTWQRSAEAVALPAGTAGEDVLQDLEQSLDSYRKRLGGLLKLATQTNHFAINCSPAMLDCDISGCSLELRLVLRSGHANSKDFIRLWINHLALNSTTDSYHSLLLDERNNWYLPILPTEQAITRLNVLLQLKHRYFHKVLPLTVDSGSAWAKKWAVSNDEKAAQLAAENSWHSNPPFSRGEEDNWAVKRIWQQPAFCHADFVSVSKQVWLPLHQALKKKTKQTLPSLIDTLTATLQP